MYTVMYSVYTGAALCQKGNICIYNARFRRAYASVQSHQNLHIGSRGIINETARHLALLNDVIQLVHTL